MLKENQQTSERSWLKVEYGSVVGEAKADEKPSGAGEKADGEKKAEAAGAGSDNEGSGSEQDEDSETKRMQFVNLLLDTKAVTAGTKFEEAAQLLGKEQRWHAVNEKT